MVANKHLRLAVETEEKKRARLVNDTATTQLRLAMKIEEKEEQKKAWIDLDLIWIEIRVIKNTNFQGMSSLAL